jgi:D-galactose 1-dehydrogenase
LQKMSTQPIRVGLVGIGKIARDQHIPALKRNAAFKLVAASSRNATVEDVPNFTSLAHLLSQGPELDAISICTPPQFHYDAARLALAHGKHVMMEKPPTTSVLQLRHLIELAKARGLSLYQTWHSQYAPAVRSAQSLLAARTLTGARVIWKEDVRVWHPGQAWIWQSGGFGVLDPGINALSILTRLINETMVVRAARLLVPRNCQTPIAATVELGCASGATIQVELDFRHTGKQTWDIEIATDAGTLILSSGGAHLSVDNAPVAQPIDQLHSEYACLYERFAQLVDAGLSEVDARPLELVADIFLIGQREGVEDFVDGTR